MYPSPSIKRVSGITKVECLELNLNKLRKGRMTLDNFNDTQKNISIQLKSGLTSTGLW